MWSAEARVLFDPGSAFRDLAQRDRDRARLASGIFILVLAIGCTVSAVAAGRFTVRLLLDGAISFAFVPALEIAALALVLSRRREAWLPFRHSAALFLAGNGPWLLWMCALSLFASITPPSRAHAWWGALNVSAVVPLLWSMFVDFHFFREVGGRSSRGALADLLLFKGIAWSAGLTYFFGITIFGNVVPLIARWVGL